MSAEMGTLEAAVAAQSQGDLVRAADLYRRVLASEPHHASAHNNLGTILFASGQRSEALQCFRAAVAADPRYGEAQANLGKACAMTGDWPNAVPALLQARQLGVHDPDTAKALAMGCRQLATAAAKGGQWEVAAAHWHTLLDVLPGDVEAAFGLGQASHVLGHTDMAAHLYEQVVRVAPERGDVWTNLGAIREGTGDVAGAEAAYRRAWAVGRDNVAAGFNLGRLLVERGEAAEALPILKDLLALAPDDADVTLTLATALAAVSDLAGAEALCRQVIARGQEAARGWLTLGNIRQAADRLDAAAEAYGEATRLRPDYLPAWRNLGSVSMAIGNLDRAQEAFDQAQQLDFDPGIAFRSALMLPPMMTTRADIKQARKRYQRGLETLRARQLSLADPLVDVGATSFYLAYHGVNDRPLQVETAKVFLQACPELAWTAPHIGRPRAADRRIRVGFASTFLRRHTIGRLYGQFVARLDRDRFDVWVFQTPGDDPMASAIAAAADHAVILTGDLATMRGQIAAVELDALIYPDIGMEPTTYFLAYARLAPVQAVLWGHPMTTGIPNVDYFLASADLETEGGQAHFSETLVRLPSVNTCFMRPAVPDPLPDRPALGLPAAGALYVCPQSLFKFHPDFDAACMAVLAADPTGHLILLQDSARQWQDILHQRLAAIDAVAAARVHFLPRLTEADFFALMRHADVILDPFHFGGGNTTLEAFAMGTPVVTLPSDFLRGRITFSLYRQMGIPDLVAEDPDAYVRLALRVAAEPAWRADLVQRIQAAWPAVFERQAAVEELADFIATAHQAAGSR